LLSNPAPAQQRWGNFVSEEIILRGWSVVGKPDTPLSKEEAIALARRIVGALPADDHKSILDFRAFPQNSKIVFIIQKIPGTAERRQALISQVIVDMNIQLRGKRPSLSSQLHPELQRRNQGVAAMKDLLIVCLSSRGEDSLASGIQTFWAPHVCLKYGPLGLGRCDSRCEWMWRAGTLSQACPG
jgi:hypothetical protein